MKKFPCLIVLVLAVSCSTDDTSLIADLEAGTYQLIEVLADPGDGSGTFHPVESDLKLIIDSDGTYSINGSLCPRNIQPLISSGYFDPDTETVHENGCDYELAYEIIGGLGGIQIIIYQPCIEPCALKFASTSLR